MTITKIYEPVHKDDDLAAYVAQYSEQEQEELRVASLALDIVYLRERAKRDGRYGVVTISVPWFDLRSEVLTRYLRELGARVQITEQTLDTGRYLEVAPAPRPRHKEQHAHAMD